MSTPLSTEERRQALIALPNWVDKETGICREFQLGDFDEAMAFVNNVAELARRANHHPDLDIRYSTVAVRLSTHSAGGVTENDITLAQQIDRL